MTSKLRCPVCGGELVNIIGLPGCTKCNFLGNEYTRKALIRTQKQLEIARQALEKYADEDMWGTGHKWDVEYIQGLFLEHGYKIAKEALEQINCKQDCNPQKQ